MSIPKRPLGKTGEEVSILCLGGGHIARDKLSDDESISIMHRAIDDGMTFFDNAWEYSGGRSEELMGRAIADRRDRVFLMTKVCARDARGAMDQLEESLKKLKTDVIDLWQFHEVNYANDPEWIFREGGAAEAALEAVKSGKVRYLGYTGHKDPAYLLKMLDHDFPWATVQCPVNILDVGFKSFIRQLLPAAKAKGLGALGMKSLGGEGQLVWHGGLTPADCIRFALSQDIASLVSGIDSVEVYEQNLAIARSFEPMSEAEQDAFIAKTREMSEDGRLEWSKTTQQFDSPVHREQHGYIEPVWR